MALRHSTSIVVVASFVTADERRLEVTAHSLISRRSALLRDGKGVVVTDRPGGTANLQSVPSHCGRAAAPLTARYRRFDVQRMSAGVQCISDAHS